MKCPLCTAISIAHYSLMSFSVPKTKLIVSRLRFHYEGKELQICGALSNGAQCGVTIDCFKNRLIGDTNKIGIFPKDYTIGINVARDVDALCFDHDLSVNAMLRLKCAEGTLALTSELQPTQTTNEPSQSPSNAPTLPTPLPTLSPTWSVMCDCLKPEKG